MHLVYITHIKKKKHFSSCNFQPKEANCCCVKHAPAHCRKTKAVHLVWLHFKTRQVLLQVQQHISASKMLNCTDPATDGLHVILARAVLEISHEKTRHNIVGRLPVNQACTIVVDKPAGDLITILHVDAEVPLLMPVDETLI